MGVQTFGPGFVSIGPPTPVMTACAEKNAFLDDVIFCAFVRQCRTQFSHLIFFAKHNVFTQFLLNILLYVSVPSGWKFILKSPPAKLETEHGNLVEVGKLNTVFFA